MCFEKTEVFSTEGERIIHSEIGNTQSENDSVHLWHSSDDNGNFKFSEIKDDNFSIWHCEFNMIKAAAITLKAPSNSSIGLSFTLKKNIHYSLKELGHGIARKNQYNMIFLPDVSCEYNFNKGEYASFGIQFTLEYLQRLGTDNYPVFTEFINSVKENKAATISPYHLTMTSEMQLLIQDMLLFRYKGSLPKLYLQGKVVELLRMSVENISTSQPDPLIDLRADDIRKIHFAKEHILKNIDSPGSFSAIAQAAGINEWKLKFGFKQLFNKTVFNYIHEERLGRARTLILETGLPMKTIANDAGYRSLSNFNTAFRRAFGYPPGRLKRGSE